MATREELYQALRNADAAGDTEGARKLASYIQSMPADKKPATVKQNAATGEGYDEGSFGDKVSKGALNLLTGAVRGAGSIGATLMYPIDKAQDAYYGDTGKNIKSLITGKEAPTRNEERRRKMDEGLRDVFGADTDSLTYQGGKLAGEIAGTAGAGGVLGQGVVRAAPLLARAGVSAPAVANVASALATGGMRAGAAIGKTAMGLRVLGGAANGATSAAMVDPRNMLTGGLVGGALPPVLAGIGKVGQTIGRSFAIGEGNRALANQAMTQYGIPLGVGDIAEGGTIKAMRSMLNDAPFSGGIGMAQREATQEGFNKAVGGTFGAAEKKLTADVLDAAKKRMGSEFDRIWNGNALQVDGAMVAQLQAMRQQAAKLPKNEGASLAAEIDDIFAKMAPSANGGTSIPGDVANKFQSYLRRRAEGSAGLKNELGDLRQSIISAFNRGIAPADEAALTLNRTQYKAFKTVEQMLNGTETGVAGRMAGDVPASLLPAAVAKQYSQAAGTPLADLAKIGSRFMVDRTAKTGGSMRAALQNTALGTAIVGGGLTNPLLASAAIPAAAGINSALGSPSLARYLLQQRTGNSLTRLLGPQVEQLGYRTAPLLTDQ